MRTKTLEMHAVKGVEDHRSDENQEQRVHMIWTKHGWALCFV